MPDVLSRAAIEQIEQRPLKSDIAVGPIGLQVPGPFAILSAAERDALCALAKRGLEREHETCALMDELIAWCDARRDAPEITTLGNVQAWARNRRLR